MCDEYNVPFIYFLILLTIISFIIKNNISDGATVTFKSMLVKWFSKPAQDGWLLNKCVASFIMINCLPATDKINKMNQLDIDAVILNRETRHMWLTKLKKKETGKVMSLK